MIVSALLAVVLQTAAPAATPVVVPEPTVLGLTDDDVVAVVDQLKADVVAAGGTPAGAPAIDEACRADDACLRATMASQDASVLVALGLTRVGDELDIEEVVVTTEGVRRSQRTVSMAALAGAMLSDEAQQAVASAQSAGGPTTTTEAPSSSGDAGEGPPVGMITTVAGGAVLGIGLVAFGVEAATLEDPTSAGADKERARTMGGIYLGAAVIGAVATGVGVGLLALGE